MDAVGPLLCTRTHRRLQASVGHVAADGHVLVVFAGVKRHLSVATLCDGPLPARALHAVHVDGAGTYRERETKSMNTSDALNGLHSPDSETGLYV